jgi:hypothetical protein
MARQASVNGDKAGQGRLRNGVAGMGQIVGLARDAAALAELQAKLVALDYHEASENAAAPAVVAVVSLAATTASLPVGLLGASWLLAPALGISLGWAMLLTSGATLFVGGLTARLAGARIRRSFASFRRSREELERNLAWFRSRLD